MSELNERGRTSDVLKGADACGVWWGRGRVMYVLCLNVGSRYICSSKPFVYLNSLRPHNCAFETSKPMLRPLIESFRNHNGPVVSDSSKALRPDKHIPEHGRLHDTQDDPTQRAVDGTKLHACNEGPRRRESLYPRPRGPLRTGSTVAGTIPIVESAFLPIAFGPRGMAPASQELAGTDSTQSLVSGRYTGWRRCFW